MRLRGHRIDYAGAHFFFGGYWMALDIEDPFRRDSEAVRMEFIALI
jgi:hypothetical protein